MAITLEGRPKRTYPFAAFHNSSRSNYRQKMGSKLFKHLGMCPRQLRYGCQSYNALNSVLVPL